MILIAWVKVILWALGTALLGLGVFAVLLRRETWASGLKEAEPFVANDIPEYVITPVEVASTESQRVTRWSDELPVNVANDEERRVHQDARRFARLLISEIKLYNEGVLDEGRSEHNLYERLKDYIDRSREMYDKRVNPEVAAKYDYFYDELVNILAQGDPTKLGTHTLKRRTPSERNRVLSEN